MSALPQEPLLWPATLLPAEEVLQRAFGSAILSHFPSDALLGVRRVLAGLTQAAGDSWQQRWINSGCDAAGRDWVSELAGPWRQVSEARRRKQANTGLSVLICMDILRPSYNWLHTSGLVKASWLVRDLRSRDFVQKCTDYARRQGYDWHLDPALMVISRIMLRTGRAAREITPEDVVDYRVARSTVDSRPRKGIEFAWDLLALFGTFPKDTLPIRDVLRGGTVPASEIVARYRLRCRPVEELLIRYLDERAPELDYGTLRQLAYRLAHTFWKDLEEHNPGISSIALGHEAAAEWKQRVRARFQYPWGTLIAVRAFYLDIAHWATHDAYWAGWATRCPVTLADTRGMAKHAKRVRASMHQRTRLLAPYLPVLLRKAEEHLTLDSGLLTAARNSNPGESFMYQGIAYQRAEVASARTRGRLDGWTRSIWLHDLRTGKRVNQSHQDDYSFWTWAAVNTLYYTGVRLEELAELTTTALFMYQPSDGGQAIPLLQIAPSKTDAERVLIVPPELAHVLARIKQRVRDGHATVPTTTRYDSYERKISPPLPFLFQRKRGTQRRVISPAVFGYMLSDLIKRASIVDPNGDALHVTPHDFRRAFATEAVASGLPIHIVSKLLGHESLATTQGYVAVYPQDTIRHYRGFIMRRRSLRPVEDYRDPTAREWEEFHQHFHKRKVELGTCGRGYGTPCAHEHACLRCPMLRPDPQQRPRLEDITMNLRERLDEARQRGWHGEIEGIKVSIAAAEDKLNRMQKIVELGLPTASPR